MKNIIKLKKYFLTVVSLILLLSLVKGQDCINNISTNPNDPVNTSLADDFPGKINPWINTFDFGSYQNSTFDEVPLNPDAGWLVPDWTTLNNLTMMSPFTNGGAAGAPYLIEPTNSFQNRDFHWEDGWELLYLGTGYYPGGGPIHLSDPNRIISQATNLLNQRVPYMVYYNRYQSKIRIFAGLIVDFGTFQSASVDLVLNGSAPLDTKYSGLLRHLSPYDKALDQITDITKISGVNPIEGANNPRVWYTFDFQVGYDPCTCQDISYLDFVFHAVSSSNINLYGRMISTNEDLAGANQTPFDVDGFLAVQNVNEGSADGYIMRDRLNNLVEDYRENLNHYNNQMADQEFLQNGYFRSVLDDFKDQAVGAAVDLIPGGDIAQFLYNNCLNLGASTDDIDKMIQNGSKSIIGKQYDFLSNQIFGDNVDPVRPTIPTASFSEMRFSGNVTETNSVYLNGFINPGSDFSGSDITAFNYPAYNEILGLYATLKTPQVEVLAYNKPMETKFIKSEAVLDSTHFWHCYYYDWDSTVWKSKKLEQFIYLKLKNPIEYALNGAVDINEEKTKVYVSIDVELKNNEEESFGRFTSNSQLDSFNYSKTDSTNLITFHNTSQLPLSSISSHKGFPRKVVLKSGWYNIENSANLLLGTSFDSELFYREKYDSSYTTCPTPPGHENEINESVPNITEAMMKFKPAKIEVKVMADMYFDQLSYTGEEINTTQVFTYLLVDTENGIDLIAENGNYLPPAETTSFVQMVPGMLHIESMVLTSSSPEILYPNNESYPWLVRADKIVIDSELTGEVIPNSPDPLIRIEAYDFIKLSPGAEVGPNINLKINKQIYGAGESMPATPKVLESFCKSDSYNAGETSDKAKNAIIKRKLIKDNVFEHKDYQDMVIKIYPNPTQDISKITVESANDGMFLLELFDMNGKKQLDKEIYSETGYVSCDINLSGFAAGLYLIRTTDSNGVVSGKRIQKL